MTEPILIKAGDSRVKLGIKNEPPKVDCRVIAEDLYQTLYTEEECRNMVFNYAQYVSCTTFYLRCMSAEESQCVEVWFEKNKKL